MRARTIKQEIVGNPQLWNWQKKRVLYTWLIIALCILSVAISAALACGFLAFLFVYMTIFLIQNKRLKARITTEVLEQIDTESYAVLKEQGNIVKGHPKYRRLCRATKVNIAFLCFGFIAFLASPPFGVIFLVIGLVWLVIGTLRKSRVKKEVADFLEQGIPADWWNLDNKLYVKLLMKQPSGIRHEANPVQVAYANAKAGVSAEPAAAPNNGGNRQRNRAAEAVVGTAAAYAAGKAVGDAVKKTDAYQKVARNPQTNQNTLERQMNLQGQQGRNRTAGGNSGKEKVVVQGRTYYISTSNNGDQILTDVGGRRLGRYDRMKNETRDAGMRMVGKGNCLRDLID